MEKKVSGTPFTNDTTSLSDDLLWNADEIASEIGRTRRQTIWMLEKGRLPARKIGGSWCSSRTALRSFFASTFLSEAA